MLGFSQFFLNYLLKTQLKLKMFLITRYTLSFQAHKSYSVIISLKIKQNHNSNHST